MLFFLFFFEKKKQEQVVICREALYNVVFMIHFGS